MSTDPLTIQGALRAALPSGGSAVRPEQVASATDHALHGLCNVLRDLVHKSPHVYHNEADLLAARDAIDTYEKSVYGLLKYVEEVVRFDDRAAHEDVRDRVPAPIAAQQGGGAIDYDQLAAAILRVQRGASAPVEPSSIVSGAQIAAAQGGGASL